MPLYSDLDDLECPECGGAMELKQPKQGQTWKPFYGCLSFPKCRGTRTIGGKDTKRFSKEVKPLTLSVVDTDIDVPQAVERTIRFNGVDKKYTPPDTQGMTQDKLKVAYLQAKGFIPPDEGGGKSISYKDNRSLFVK